MQAISDLKLDYFLPLPRMRELAKSARASYLNAKPYPHVVFDNFFDPAVLELVLAEFPKPARSVGNASITNTRLSWLRQLRHRSVPLHACSCIT